MKKLLLAGVGVVAMATAATAADLPARMPVKAPAYVAQVYNWTGFYVGGHVGWGRVNLDSTVVAAPAGFGTGSIGGDRESGFLGGGQVGFNYQIGQFVVGVEGDVSWTDIGRTNTFGLLTERTNVDWTATLAARLGYAFGPALLYVKGGVAWQDWTTTLSATGIGSVSASDTKTGYVLGAGLEYAFTPNWSAKLEYNYLDFGTERWSGGGFTVDTDVSSHIVKAGINYRFGG